MTKISTYNERTESYDTHTVETNYYINKAGRFTTDSTDAAYQFHTLPQGETPENLKLTFDYRAFGEFDAVVYADYITKL